jgi:hypothetical protein
LQPIISSATNYFYGIRNKKETKGKRAGDDQEVSEGDTAKRCFAGGQEAPVCEARQIFQFAEKISLAQD